MSTHRYEGRSAAEAAIKACEELGVTRSELKYDVVTETGEGIDRRVVISVDADAQSPRQSRPVEAPVNGAANEERRPRREVSFDRPRGDRGGRDRDRGGGRGRDRDRGGRGGRDRDRGDRRPRREAPPREADDGIEALLKLEAAPANAPARPEISTAPSPKAAQAKSILNEMLKHMGWQAQSVIVQDDAEEIQLDVTGADAAKVIGKKGEPLLSMQFLVNRMVSRDAAEGDQVIVLDVAGYRERRRAALADLARRLAARALEERKVVKLSPMSAHDRRVFHLTLTEIEGVTTRSEGDGLYRRLLIIPSEFASL